MQLKSIDNFSIDYTAIISGNDTIQKVFAKEDWNIQTQNITIDWCKIDFKISEEGDVLKDEPLIITFSPLPIGISKRKIIIVATCMNSRDVLTVNQE